MPLLRLSWVNGGAGLDSIRVDNADITYLVAVLLAHGTGANFNGGGSTVTALGWPLLVLAPAALLMAMI